MQSMNSEYGSPYLATCHVTHLILNLLKKKNNERPVKLKFDFNTVVSAMYDSLQFIILY